MKKLEETEEKVVIEFTEEEYLKFKSIVRCVNQEYEILDPSILDLTKEETRTFLNSLYAMEGI